MSTSNESVLESSRSREIVREILDFGVSDYQIRKIIKFLSLELEDRNLMQSIIALMEGEEDSDPSSEKPRLQL
tara:strand:- start:331 stop:549 length:219 start_codon:yes stop_codon:yes gene_type:complete